MSWLETITYDHLSKHPHNTHSEDVGVRGGYFFENIDKGGRKFLTLGAGLKYNNLGLDFSYLSTVENDHPLAETMRFSISFIFDKEETFDDLSNQ